MTVPSVIAGALAPKFAPFWLIQLEAALRLASVPALSAHAVTETPPSAVRISV